MAGRGRRPSVAQLGCGADFYCDPFVGVLQHLDNPSRDVDGRLVGVDHQGSVRQETALSHNNVLRVVEAQTLGADALDRETHFLNPKGQPAPTVLACQILLDS